MKKKKFRVFKYIPMLSALVMILGFVCVYFVIANSNEEDIISYSIISIVRFVFIPLILVINSCVKMWSCIEFSETGIRQTLFGKLNRFITWEEAQEIKRINTGIAEWVFFSKISLEGLSIDKCRRRKDNIFIVSTKEIEEVIKRFAPSRLF